MSKAINNARDVLDKIEKYLAAIDAGDEKSFDLYGKGFDAGQRVCDELSVFDWWGSDRIGKTKLKAMRSFIKLALKLGYEGYVSFTIGATGLSNGMWAYRAESYDGYSPDGAFLYRSFTPDYTRYYFRSEDGAHFPPAGKDDMITTIEELEVYHNAIVGHRW